MTNPVDTTVVNKLRYQKVDPFKDFIEVTLKDQEDFLIVKETLTRIGVPSPSKKELYQTAHILHKQGRYFIVHFKQMFALDGKPTNFDDEDQARLNTIANLLVDWQLVKLVKEGLTKEPLVPIGRKLRVLSSKEKADWTLKSKYAIGKTKKEKAPDNVAN